LAALLSHLGLSAMFANIVANLLLIALLAWAVFFVVRRLRSRASSMHGEPRAAQSAYGSASTLSRPAARDNTGSNSWYAASDTGTVGTSATPLAGSSSFSDPPEMADNRQIPSDFDETRFLQQAKAQFIRIQAVWDSNNLELLRESLTDELMSELATQFPEQKQAGSQTEVVLLNAELLSVETVPEGELASVRFSGMLREEAGAPAVHFEEIWNLLKSAQHGWLLAGIQQISDAAPTPGQ
jgi:predicted lipid-binding transport protein (Tim44 family)